MNAILDTISSFVVCRIFGCGFIIPKALSEISTGDPAPEGSDTINHVRNTSSRDQSDMQTNKGNYKFGKDLTAKYFPSECMV